MANDQTARRRRRALAAGGGAALVVGALGIWIRPWGAPRAAAPSLALPQPALAAARPAAGPPGPQLAPPPAAAARPGGTGEVTVEIADPPPGLRVTVDGRPVDVPVKLPRGPAAHRLVFAAPEHDARTVTLDGTRDRTLVLSLRPKRAAPAPAAADKSRPPRIGPSPRAITDL